MTLNTIKEINWRKILLPFTEWVGEVNSKEAVSADVIAGVSVALVLIPQSMAYASLAGLPAYYGLYAAFLPGIVAALFGSSRQLATGPVAVVSLLTASALEPLVGTNPESYVSYAITLALMVGIFQFSLGVLRLGVLVDFLSHPVVLGFTNAAAIIIGTSQLGRLFGVSVEKTDHTYETVWNTLVAASTDPHLLTLGMAALALTIMIGLKKYAPRTPSVLVAVVITTLLAYFAGFENAGGKVVGAVPAGLPAFKLPEVNFGVVTQLITIAVTVGLIGFMEAVSIAKTMAAQTRQRLDANQELIGQGLANIVGSMFQSYTVAGSFSRSAVNINTGAKTGFSAVVTGIVVCVTLLFFTPALYHLPQATLAAVIIMAVANLVKLKPIIHTWKAQPHDGVVAVVTFVLTLILAPHLDKGIIIGVLLAIGLYMYRTMRPRVVVLARHPDGTLRDAEMYNLELCHKISIIRFDGSLYFANTGYFENKVLERVAVKPDLKCIIIDAEAINDIDATGEQMLHSLTRRLKTLDIELYFTRAKGQIMDVFRRTGFLDYLGEDHFFRIRTHALVHVWGDIGCNREQGCPLASMAAAARTKTT